MRLLLDTHIILWWFENNPLLSTQARNAIGEGKNDVFVSAVSTWEMTIKKALGKLRFPADIEERMHAHRFTLLPITVAHTFAVGKLPFHHNDPFDRLLVAQADVEGLTLVTHDKRLQDYHISILLT